MKHKAIAIPMLMLFMLVLIHDMIPHHHHDMENVSLSYHHHDLEVASLSHHHDLEDASLFNHNDDLEDDSLSHHHHDLEDDSSSHHHDSNSSDDHSESDTSNHFPVPKHHHVSSSVDYELSRNESIETRQSEQSEQFLIHFIFVFHLQKNSLDYTDPPEIKSNRLRPAPLGSYPFIISPNSMRGSPAIA